MGLNRRSWLKITTVGIGMLFTGGGLAWFNRNRITRLQSSDIESYLRQNFSYLSLDVSEQDFEKFYHSFTEHYGQIPRLQWHLFRGRDRTKFDRTMDELATTFLLSTDFFLNGADENKKVRYITLYNPYASPCWNPISTAAAQNQVSTSQA